jgi:hypothetical protein
MTPPTACVPLIGPDLAVAIDLEISRSAVHATTFASLHEAYAVILEELDEVWEITLQKRKDRNPGALRKELIQVAAMAIKAIHSMPNLTGGSV